MLARKHWHKSITEDVVMEMCERRSTSLDNPGICLQCGQEAEGVEPDARNYTCESCGAAQVFGCEELLISIF